MDLLTIFFIAGYALFYWARGLKDLEGCGVKVFEQWLFCAVDGL
jgi:hypothetical protein